METASPENTSFSSMGGASKEAEAMAITVRTEDQTITMAKTEKKVETQKGISNAEF